MIAEPENNGNGETPGGQGGEIIDPHHKRQHVSMVERAVRQGWDIPPSAMKVLPSEMARIAIDRDLKPRERVAATKAVIAMHGQNQADDPTPQHHNHTHLVLTPDQRQRHIDAIVAERFPQPVSSNGNGNGSGNANGSSGSE